MKTKLELVGARAILALLLRQHGMTYRLIGKKIGVSGCRALQIIRRAGGKLREYEGVEGELTNQ